MLLSIQMEPASTVLSIRQKSYRYLKPYLREFGDGEQEISGFWREYYRELGLSVPLSQPGTNPSQLAASPSVKR